MNKFHSFLILLGITISLQINAQSFTTQTLNKEQFKSAVSLTQDYDNDGDLDIIVSRWEPAGIYVLENDENKQFPATPIITEDLPFYLADIDAADFDNDGDVDYVVCFSAVNDGELAWFQRQDDGSYQKWTIATNLDFIEADVADFNGDGFIDVAVVGLDNSNQTCKVYLNQANLFFSELVVASSDVGDAIDVDDIDGDGDFDIVVTGGGFIDFQTCEASGSREFINDGNGNFSVGRYFRNGFSFFTSFWETIQIVDLNNDNVKDIVSFSSVATGGLMFLDGNNLVDCNALLATQIDNDNAGVGADIGGHFVIFDIDGNGLLDIVRQEQDDKWLSVLYQVSNLSFQKERIELNWDNCCNPTTKMSFGDLDNDGDLDLIFPEQGNVDNDISWFENINGRLYKHQIYGELDGVRIPKMVDWDNDGDLDIFATVASGVIDNTEDELILYENIDGENFINWRINDALDYAADIEFADIDGDGDLDAFATARDADDLVWLRNDGFQANWVTNTIFAEGNTPLGIASDDLDDDGDADVVVCSFNDNKVFGFLNDGSGNFNPIVVDANIDGPREVEIADLDNDGDKDIAVVSTAENNSVVVYFNDGSENFDKQVVFTNESGRDIEVGDWNQDGILDILACFVGSSTHVVSFIYDNGNYLLDTLQLPVDGVSSIKLADLDGDNDLDLISGHNGGTNNSGPIIFANISSFGEIETSIPLSNNEDGNILGIDVGDINNDDILDIVYADFQQDDLVLLTVGCLVVPTPSISTEDATCHENNGNATIDLSLFTDPVINWDNGANTATIANLVAGDYEVTITDANGCASSATITIQAIPSAEIAVVGTNTTCGNEDGSASASIISGNVVSYQWSTGENTASISNLAGGSYTLTATDENNCEIISSIDIEGLTNPTVDLGEDITITQGETISLDATGEDLNYAWSTGETTPTITVAVAGTYTVTVTNAQGCSATDEVEVTVITGVANATEEEKQLWIYPNPTRDIISVVLPKNSLGIHELQLINASGQLVLRRDISPSSLSLDINLVDLPNGLYLIYLRTDSGYLFHKVIKA